MSVAGPEAVRAREVAPFAEMALASLHREYPSHVTHLLRSAADIRPPRELTPAFYGCFDWHSAVHGHWCLVRVARCFPDANFAARARAAAGESLTPERIAGEVAYLGAEERRGFERPYGLAWLLQLCAELREWEGDAAAAAWLAALAPLEALAASRLADWLPKLPWPIRSGEHSQTAFAMGLGWDWARAAREAGFAAMIGRRARDLYGGDAGAPIAYEPSGHDFLSPVLAEADLMRRVLPAAEFATWLERFLPDLESDVAARWLTPVASPDRADGKLAHLDGLDLSRAWMLEGIVAALPPAHRCAAPLREAARRHREQGLAGATGEHYEGGHWLGSFAVYLLTGRGLR